MQDISAPLAAITGPEHLRAMDSAIAVAPGNSEEVAAVLRFANENHLPVVTLRRRHQTGLGLFGCPGADFADAPHEHAPRAYLARHDLHG